MNKLLFFIYSVLVSSIALGAPCNGASGANHINPDGSVGGFVAATATVSKTVTLDSSSTVCEKAVVQGNVKIRSGSEIKGSVRIEGNAALTASKAYGIAKIFGNSVVTNSKICQASDINFNVINSDYYCQTDDEEPRDPGEAGKKTIIGVDSNLNGIRDDVEIWINNIATNTPTKNLQNSRKAMKQVAKHLQNSTKFKEIPTKAREARIEAIYSFNCLEAVTSAEEIEEFKGELQVQMYNTMDRLRAWAKAEGTLNGLSSLPERKSNCEFQVK